MIAMLIKGSNSTPYLQQDHFKTKDFKKFPYYHHYYKSIEYQKNIQKDNQ